MIGPVGCTRAIRTFRRGFDGLYLDGSVGNYDYLSSLPSYYKFELRPESLLVFNNSACLHHFKNLGTDDVIPEALSTRVKYAACADLRVMFTMATNYTTWWRYANVFLELYALDNRSEERRQGDIEGMRAVDAATGGGARERARDELPALVERVQALKGELGDVRALIAQMESETPPKKARGGRASASPARRASRSPRRSPLRRRAAA